MSKILREKNLEFDFTKASTAIKFDKHRIPKMDCLKAVDFYIEWQDQVWLVEIKKPQDINKLKNIKRKMVAQGKESFLYLYLNNRLDSRPLMYFVVIDWAGLPKKRLKDLTDQLKVDICLSNKSLLKNKYIDSAGVFSTETWNENDIIGKKCRVERIT
jgi:hypothetical protein